MRSKRNNLLQSMQMVLSGLDETLRKELSCATLRDFRLIPRRPYEKLTPVQLDLDLGDSKQICKRLRVTMSAESISVAQIPLPIPAKNGPVLVTASRIGTRSNVPGSRKRA